MEYCNLIEYILQVCNKLKCPDIKLQKGHNWLELGNRYIWENTQLNGLYSGRLRVKMKHEVY